MLLPRLEAANYSKSEFVIKIAPNRLFLRQNCSLLSKLSILYRKFCPNRLGSCPLTPYRQASPSVLRALNWNLRSLRLRLLAHQNPCSTRSDSLYVQIVRQVSTGVQARRIRILRHDTWNYFPYSFNIHTLVVSATWVCRTFFAHWFPSN